jgi:hypothetical protein
MQEVPRVKVLVPLTPRNAGTGDEALEYSGLTPAINRYEPTHKARWDAVLDSEIGSFEEIDAASELASQHMLLTADKVVQSSVANRDFWADQFTKSSIEIYGEPDKVEAAKMAKQKYDWLVGLKDNDQVSQEHVDYLLGIYGPIVEADKSEIEEPETFIDYEKVVDAYNEAMLAKYKPIFDRVDKIGLEEFTPDDIAKIFRRSLRWLRWHDGKEWKSWKVIQDDSNKLMVQPEDCRIRIGSKRAKAKPARVKALLAHELLTHALRAKNGYSLGDKQLASGLAGYNDSEEGFAKIAELAFSGEAKEPSGESYLELALALGTLEDGHQRTRKQLYNIVYAHKLLRAQEDGDDLTKLAKGAWSRVDRLYRGGRGDDTGERQTIYTKDLVYYVGFKKMALYVQQQLETGKSPVQIFEYVTQGKFDPTDELNTKRLEEAKQRALGRKANRIFGFFSVKYQ